MLCSVLFCSEEEFAYKFLIGDEMRGVFDSVGISVFHIVHRLRYIQKSLFVGFLFAVVVFSVLCSWTGLAWMVLQQCSLSGLTICIVAALLAPRPAGLRGDNDFFTGAHTMKCALH